MRHVVWIAVGLIAGVSLLDEGEDIALRNDGRPRAPVDLLTLELAIIDLGDQQPECVAEIWREQGAGKAPRRVANSWIAAPVERVAALRQPADIDVEIR